MDRAPLLTFSHLRWNSVFQRPHHIMTRMSARGEVLYIEEPITRGGDPGFEIIRVAPRVRVIQPHLPMNGPGFGARQHDLLESGLRRLIAREGWQEYTAWLYTPMAVRLARALEPRAIVYDCMDELSAFLLAPPELPELERELLSSADVVFTGGPSLHRAKKPLHDSVHCLPSSVDAAHFAGASETSDAREQAYLPRPRLGFFGVIDERMDLEILDYISSERPEWEIVMVGPLAKIDGSSLPRGRNIHYMGQRAYQDLPGFLAGWDVCMMPFAMNAATRYISPAKCLEYMAADRPIVSTPIPDVAEPYGDIIYLGMGPQGFLKACERALSETDASRRKRRALAAEVLQRTSWEETVDRMDAIVQRLSGKGARRRAPAVRPATERSMV